MSDEPLAVPGPGKEPDPNKLSFLKFKREHDKEIAEVQGFLSLELSDNPVQLEADGRLAESWYGRMTTLKAWARSFLVVARRDRLPVKSKEVAELDRKTELDASCFEEQRLVDVIDGLVDSLSCRISFCQSVMKANAAEARRSGMAT